MAYNHTDELAAIAFRTAQTRKQDFACWVCLDTGTIQPTRQRVVSGRVERFPSGDAYPCGACKGSR